MPTIDELFDALEKEPAQPGRPLPAGLLELRDVEIADVLNRLSVAEAGVVHVIAEAELRHVERRAVGIAQHEEWIAVATEPAASEAGLRRTTRAFLRNERQRHVRHDAARHRAD